MKHFFGLVGAVILGAGIEAQNLTTGDVVAGVNHGVYNVYDNSGNFILSLDDGLGGFTTGAFYDTTNNLLYTTDFTFSTVVVYDGLAPHAIVNSIPTGGESSESIVFDASGDFYVGHAGGDGDIRKFSSAGALLDTFDVVIDDRGSDWIDLAKDQKTMFYTSEGQRLLRYDVAAHAQLADFALLPGPAAYALRLLPPFDGTGGLIVADSQAIYRLDSTGAIVQTYDVAGEDFWFAMNLDPNGTSFWGGDFGTDNFYRFNITTGAIEVGPINTGLGGNLFGLAVVGEITGGTATCFTFNFDTEDDLVTPLGNGQSISTPPEFGTLVSISSSGPNLGVTAFDSTPGGPNSGTSDPDMLIDRGNILMLQDDGHPAQTVPGFFDTPIDDPDGGDFIFDFSTLATAHGVTLIDLDPEPNLGASVVLIDQNGGTRTYTVPPGWTGTYGGAPGWKTLDLDTLADQIGNAPGFRRATASETARFDPEAVVRMVVHLTGLGAMDDLNVCFPSASFASAKIRNGSGLNPAILTTDSRPVIGTTWRATLDTSALGNGVVVLESRKLPTAGTVNPFGELLVKGSLFHRTSRVYSAGTSTFAFHIPYNLSLAGLEVHVQGFLSGPTTMGQKVAAVRRVATNAIDLVVGL